MTKPEQKDSFIPPLWLLTVATIVLFLWLVVQLKEIVALLVVGYCIAYVMNPAISFLERKRIPRAAGFIIICVALIVFVTVLALTAMPTISAEFDRLSNNFPSYVEAVKEKVVPLVSDIQRVSPEAGALAKKMVESPLELLKSVSSGAVKRVAQAVYSTLLGGYSLTLTIINLCLVPFITFYLAIGMPQFYRWLLALFPGDRRKRVASIVAEMDDYVSAFVRGQFLVACILFVLYAIGLGMVGVELWFLLAVIAGFGNFVPYLGLIVGLVLSIIMTLITFGSFWPVLQVFLVFVVVQFLEGSFITPRIVGEKVGISPLVVILAIFAGGSLFGLLGVLLAVPGAAVMKVLMEHAHKWVLSRV